MGKLLSIVIPVYNTYSLIERCLDSLLKSKENCFEVLIINDGSTDNSLLLCEQISAIDKRVKVFTKTNGGLSSARNYGINVSTGEYIQFLDSDDCLANGAIDILIDHAKNCDFDVYEFGYKTIKNGKTVEEYLPIQIDGERTLANILEKTHFRWYAWKYLFRKSFLVSNGLFFPEGINYEDVYLIPRALSLVSHIAPIMIEAYEYQLGRPGSITSKPNLKNELNRLTTVKKNFEFFDSLSDRRLKMELLNNISKEFYASLSSYSFFAGEEKKTLLKELKGTKFIVKYTKNGKQKIVRFLIPLFGLRIVAKLLHFRRMVKKHDSF